MFREYVSNSKLQVVAVTRDDAQVVQDDDEGILYDEDDSKMPWPLDEGIRAPVWIEERRW